MAEKKQLLYLQLRDRILEDYRDKASYFPLPGERDLCEIYNVSRPTVRKALEILEEEGCIARFAGKGAFFIGEKEQKSDGDNISRNIAFYNQVRLRGDYTNSKVLTQKVILSDRQIADALGIKEGEKVFHLERLRYINGQLWSHSDTYSVYEMCPEVVKYDYAERSFHNTLASHGFVPFIGKRHITAKKADEYEAFNLGLNKDDLLYFCETHTYDKEGRLLEYTVSRTDILKMSISLETTNQPIILKKEEE